MHTFTILISGASSGIGNAFMRAYLNEPNVKILAIDRVAMDQPQANVHFFKVDVSSQQSIDAFAVAIKEQPIDLFIHSAGIRGLVPEVEQLKPDDVAACETLQVMNSETMLRTFEINTIGSFMLIRAMLPSLRQRHGKVVVMTSRMGSLSNNQHPNKDAGSAYAYRASKAALNAVVRSFAADVKDATFILCHPGRVETALVKCVEEGAISAAESVLGLLPLIKAWGSDDSGGYFDRFGEPIPW